MKGAVSKSITSAVAALAILIACGPQSAAARDGCPDATAGMDYCGLCKSTGDCHYCSTGHCLASDPCSCGAGPVTCGPGTHAVNGVCELGSSSSSGATSSSGTTTSGGSSGDIGLPCTSGAHPAWQDNECATATTCKFCSVRSCVRVTQQGCCMGVDTPSEFFPCNGCSGDCTSAATSAAHACGCDQ